MAYQQLQDALRGVAFTIPTPFSEDGDSVRHDAIEDHVAFLTDAGAEVIIPCGNTGEYYSLSHEERIEVVRTTVEAAGDDATVIAGAGGSTKTALDLVSAYEDIGADAAMVMNPAHTYVHQRGLGEYYRAVADATDLGVVLYKRSHAILDDLLVDLAGRENVVAVKYAVNDIKAFSGAAARTDEVVWSNGIAERYAPAFAVEGAEGFTTGIGNFAPEASLALYDALDRGDWERAREIRDTLRPLEDLREEAGAGNDLAAANNVPVVKAGLELAGLYGGPVREPIVELEEDDEARVREYYERVEDAGLLAARA